MKFISFILIGGLVGVVNSCNDKEKKESKHESKPEAILNEMRDELPAKLSIQESPVYSDQVDLSNNWDLDGDGENDSILFIRIGDDHTYYYPRITLLIDNTYPNELNSLNQETSDLSRFVASDITKDGILDLIISLDDQLGTIPDGWRDKGVKTRSIVLSFAGGDLDVKDFNN